MANLNIHVLQSHFFISPLPLKNCVRNIVGMQPDVCHCKVNYLCKTAANNYSHKWATVNIILHLIIVGQLKILPVRQLMQH